MIFKIPYINSKIKLCYSVETLNNFLTKKIIPSFEAKWSVRKCIFFSIHDMNSILDQAESKTNVGTEIYISIKKTGKK